MKCYILKLLLLGLIILFQSAFSQQYGDIYNQSVDVDKTAQTTMNFLQVGIVPEATARGEAYTASGQGIRSVFFNPAGLAETDKEYEVFFSTMKWIADINYIATGVGWNLQDVGAVALTFLTVDYGDIIGTRLVPEENLGTDLLGYEETGMVDNVGSYALGLAYGRNITTNFKMGLSARYAYQKLGQSYNINDKLIDNNKGTISADLGVKYYLPVKSLCLGMSMRNFAPEVKYEEITTHLPLTFALGIAMDLIDFTNLGENNELLAAVELTHPNNYTERLHMGLDYTYSNLISLRAGYVTNHDIASLSLGFGISAEIMGKVAEINYSYSKMDIFDDVSRFSVMFAF